MTLSDMKGQLRGKARRKNYLVPEIMLCLQAVALASDDNIVIDGEELNNVSFFSE